MSDERSRSAMDLPAGLELNRSTDIFTETTIPAALRSNHSTKPGTWGVIRVLSGQLRYCVSDPRRLKQSHVLSAGAAAGIIEPTILHRVEPIGAVEFKVEFYRDRSGE